MKTIIKATLVATLTLASSLANAGLILGGNATTELVKALGTLGETYTTVGSFPTLGDVGAGDILIWGQDGQTGMPNDFTSFLNAGGDIILTGGSNTGDWRTWSQLYFQTTDTSSGWHTGSGWNSIGDTVLTKYVPDTYTFENNSHTFHMQGFLPSDDTTLYASLSSEVSASGAFREYANGGSFNYMALDFGIRTGDEAFIAGWLQGSLEAARNGLAPVEVPAPQTLAIFAMALLGFSIRKAKQS